MSSGPLLPSNNESTVSNEDYHPHTSPFQALKPSILIILLILSLTIIVSVSLCLLLRLLNRRCLRHLSPSTAVNVTVTATSSSSRHSGHRVSPENPEETVSVVDYLPLFTYSSIKQRPSSSADCAVCLSKFESDDQLRLLPLCCHAFHAHCIDAWLHSNQTCPLCRSPIHASDSDIMKALLSTSAANDDCGRTDSFRLEIGSISRRNLPSDTSAASNAAVDHRSSYSLGSFDYVVDEESEINISNTHSHRRSVSDKDLTINPSQENSLAAEIAAGSGGRSWLKDYVDRLSTSLSVSSRALSFRSSGRWFTGSSRRSEIVNVSDYDLEASRVGEEISEMFRWFSGV